MEWPCRTHMQSWISWLQWKNPSNKWGLKTYMQCMMYVHTLIDPIIVLFWFALDCTEFVRWWTKCWRCCKRHPWTVGGSHQWTRKNSKVCCSWLHFLRITGINFDNKSKAVDISFYIVKNQWCFSWEYMSGRTQFFMLNVFLAWNVWLTLSFCKCWPNSIFLASET